MELTEKEEHILLNSIGWSNLRWWEKDKLYKEPYRNHFYTSEKTAAYPFIVSLIEKKMMVDTGQEQEDKSRYFLVTEKGIDYARKILKETIKTPSRSKARYQLYTLSESDETFSEWLQNPYWNDYRKRFGVS